jgi:hypothetical protein
VGSWNFEVRSLRSGAGPLTIVRTIPYRIRMARRATVKKTYNLPPELVQRAKRVLKTRTETEAIVISLEDAIFVDEVDKAVRSASRALP